MGEQWLLQELHLALDWALRRPLVLVEHWEAGMSLTSIGDGSGHPRPNPVEFPFLSSVNFCAINIFPFPFLIQVLVQVGGSWLTLAMSQHMDIDAGVLALL